MGVDVLLTMGLAVQQEAEVAAQALLDHHKTGLRVARLKSGDRSSSCCVDAFKDVSSARGDRDTLALAAEAYVSKRLPEVRGVATSKSNLPAYSAERHARASGDVVGIQLLKAYRMAPKHQGLMWTERQSNQKTEVHALRNQTEISLPVSPWRSSQPKHHERPIRLASI